MAYHSPYVLPVPQADPPQQQRSVYHQNPPPVPQPALQQQTYYRYPVTAPHPPEIQTSQYQSPYVPSPYPLQYAVDGKKRKALYNEEWAAEEQSAKMARRNMKDAAVQTEPVQILPMPRDSTTVQPVESGPLRPLHNEVPRPPEAKSSYAPSARPEEPIIQSVERSPLQPHSGEYTSQLASTGPLLWYERFKCLPIQEQNGYTRSINRQSLIELQKHGKLSDDRMKKLESVMTCAGRAATVEDCDNKHVRYHVREAITMYVPRKKQHAVRGEVYKTLLALVPRSTQIRLTRADRSGSIEPPGWENMCSDSE